MADELSPYIVRASKGTKIFSEGDEGSEMYFVQSGKVRIEKAIAGKTEVLAVMEKGDFFGEMAVIDPVPRSASAVVAEDAELLRVDALNFEKLLGSNIEIAVRMIRKYAARLRFANDRLAGLVKDRKEVDEEIAHILDSVKKPAPEAGTQTVPTPIAQFTGEKNAVFAIKKDDITIGRADPVTSIVPDIDLTSADPLRSVSRRHARLKRVEGQFLLTEEVGVRNGTLINGQKIQAGTACTITNAAKVSFGSVALVFKILD